VRYLLDVNVLVAWGWSDHVDHEHVARWIATVKSKPSILCLSAVIPQLGFVRVSVQRAAGRLSVGAASETLAGMLQSLGNRHVFLADDLCAGQFPAWCQTAAQTTDAHLWQLARAHDAQLATLDTSIPDAYLIP
jgi:uncharacterized protein